MAGETGTAGATGATGTAGATGSGFPIFKSEGGAFDRAKFTQAIRNNAVGTITEETFEAMKAADSVAKAANIFYGESFDKNIKELAPELDPKSVYYREAYADVASDRNKIQKRLDKGEAIDGKEIFEMSKGAAIKKIENAKILKTGKATEIIENIGYRDIKDFENFDAVKEDFDSKVTDEKFKFEPLVDKFLNVLSYFNEDRPMDARTVSLLYSPENNAIISALSKILEGEGFNSESIVNVSKKYEDNLNKLIQKSKGGTVEDIRTLLPGTTGATGATGATTEQKLEEKKSASETGATGPASSETPQGTTGATGTVSPVESVSATGAKMEASSTGPTATTSTENLTQKGTTGTTGTTGSGTPGKIEEVKTEKGGDKKGKEPAAPALSESNKGILEMLGLKLPAPKEGEKKEGEEGKGATGATTGSPKADKMLEELGLTKPKGSEEKDKTDNKPKAENKETKLEEKISGDMEKKPETSGVNTPIKETVTQNLSSVSTPGTEAKNEKKEEVKTETTASTENKTGDKNQETTNEIKTAEIQQKESEDKTKKEDQDKMNKELGDNMKSMVSLLTQLNNTLKNPLMVISNDKKFH